MNPTLIIFAQVAFWLSLLVVAYAYAIYPVLIFLFSRTISSKPRPLSNSLAELPSVSLLIAALNEEQVIGERLKNALELDYPAEKMEIVIASDGSIDHTPEIVREYQQAHPGRIRLLDYPQRRGKATVLNVSIPELSGEIVLFSDANTFYDTDAAQNLARWFANPKVGVVCGKLKLVDARSGQNVDSLYWRYETFIKECEGRLGALLGSNGAIYAIRREDYVPIPSDTIIDDFMIPLLVKLNSGKQIVYDVDAIAYEETAPEIRDEFRRRCRIGAGGFQSMTRLSRLFLPTAGWTWFAFISHKVLRWFCPVFMLLALIANLALLPFPFYRATLAIQVVFYTCAVLGLLVSGQGLLAKLLRLCSMFTSMNLALLVGLWRWLSGAQRGIWQRTERSVGAGSGAAKI